MPSKPHEQPKKPIVVSRFRRECRQYFWSKYDFIRTPTLQVTTTAFFAPKKQYCSDIESKYYYTKGEPMESPISDKIVRHVEITRVNTLRDKLSAAFTSIGIDGEKTAPISADVYDDINL